MRQWSLSVHLAQLEGNSMFPGDVWGAHIVRWLRSLSRSGESTAASNHGRNAVSFSRGIDLKHTRRPVRCVHLGQIKVILFLILKLSKVPNSSRPIKHTYHNSRIQRDDIEDSTICVMMLNYGGKVKSNPSAVAAYLEKEKKLSRH
jgi:hypothetical protein